MTAAVEMMIENLIAQHNESEDFQSEASGALADLVDEYGADAVADFVEWLGEHNYPLNKADDWASDFRDSYQGQYDSEVDMAVELYSDLWEIPDHLAPYIDWDKVARDLFIGDYYQSENGHTFRSW